MSKFIKYDRFGIDTKRNWELRLKMFMRAVKTGIEKEYGKQVVVNQSIQQYGDPDGQGDLTRCNVVAIRSEWTGAKDV